MKKVLFLAVLAMVLMFAGMAAAEKITWTNPVTYADGSAISSTDQGTIQTVISIKGADEVDYTALATVKYGGKSYTGVLPVKYAPGSAVQISLSSSLYGLYSTPTVIDYTIPTVPPASPTDVVVIR